MRFHGGFNMDWLQVFTIIGVLGGFIFFMMQRMHSDMLRLDGEIKSMGSRLDAHANRIDQLYKMFVDLIKSNK
jgi:hypothetical protein